MLNSIRLYLVAIVQISLLCSCVITPPSPSDRSGSIPNNIVKPGQESGDTTHKVTSDQGFAQSFAIKPVESIEKDGLLISYSLLAIPNKNGFLLRLSLVFRNLQDRTMIVRPKVLLLDASNKKVSAYTKDGFIKISSRLKGKTSDLVNKTVLGIDSKEKMSVNSRIEWADTYWLKTRYKIPSKGIAIGELVYHGTQLKLPVQLTVHTNKQEFIFAIHAPLPEAGK
jgi:hypothetical protein